MSARDGTYEVIAGSGGEKTHVSISEPPAGPILGLTTWSSSLVIANQLHKLERATHAPSFSSGDSTNGVVAESRLKILEVGAGTGLAGLSASLIWKTDVVLTDIADVVENLSKSIALNLEALTAANVTAYAGALNWIYPDALLLHGKERTTPSDFGKFDIILAADTVYDEEHPEMLANVVKLWLSEESHAKFLIGYPLRIMHLDWIRDVWKRLEAIGLQVEQEGQVNVGEEWDDERLLEWVVWTWKPKLDLTNGVK